MDLEFSSPTIFISFFIFIITVLKVTSSRNKSSLNLNLPPGPRKLPLIGDLHLFASSQPPHHTLRDLALKHGPVMHLKLGEVCTIVISSPEAAKEVMKTHDINFATRPALCSIAVMSFGNTDIAFAPYGEYWKELRKICTSELFSVKRVQSFRPIREEEFSNLCRWIASNAGSPVNLTEKINSTTFGVVMRASFGQKTDEQDKFTSLVKEAVELAAGFHIGDLYPSIKLFGLMSGLRGKAEKIHQEMSRILGNIINEHKAASAANNSNENEKQEDLVDVLLKFHDGGRELPLTTDNIEAVLMDMFAAGTETSSATVDWAMTEMLKHPIILKKAQDEVRQVFVNKGYVDESDFHELKYLKWVIKETLRMHPPVPLLLPRESREQIEINGYRIPAKARVMVNAWAIARDPKLWKEPESFKPERHMDDSVDYKGNNFEYIPFGAGRRICPGISFGLADVEFPLAMFLYHFDWILPNGVKPEELDMSESCGITTSRKDILYAIPIVNKPLPALRSEQ